MSFKEETEFNMLPASGQKRLKEHIYSAGGVDVLKMGAIYGANGSGKSNLVKAVGLLQKIVLESDFGGIKKFKLDKNYITEPTTFEIEFETKGKIYSYYLSLSINTILEEYLYETGLKDDKLIFSRVTNNGITRINMSEEYTETEEGRLRIKLYETDLLKDNACLLRMMSESKEAFIDIKNAYRWLTKGFEIVRPTDISFFLSGALHQFPEVGNFLNEHVCSLNTGISSITLESSDINLFFSKDEVKKLEDLKSALSNRKDGIFLNEDSNYSPYAVIENGQVVAKEVVSFHKDKDGTAVKFNIDEESDGTRRLLDLLPWLISIIDSQATLLIDEIESSIHVNLLKELISKFSKDNNTKGQLIFTTHESNLLDQDILRQDEIWFAEKSPAGETGFYPLSDYEIRSDLDIRKGYLNGRFGAVPFLANLHDLNWDKYAKEEV